MDIKRFIKHSIATNYKKLAVDNQKNGLKPFIVYKQPKTMNRKKVRTFVLGM